MKAGNIQNFFSSSIFLDSSSLSCY